MPNSLTMPSSADPLGTFDAGAAWLSLSHAKRDLIGSLAIQLVFAGLVGQEWSDDADKLLTSDVREAALDHEAVVAMALTREVENAFSAVFGASGKHPDWMHGAPTEDTDEQFLQRVVVEPLQRAVDGFSAPSDDRRTDAEFAEAANDAGWLLQDDGRRWARLADAHEPGAEPFGNGRHALIVASAQEACERDGIRTDRQIADAAINGLRRVFVPATMLTEA